MKSITFFDLETTGSDPKVDRIVEIALIRIEDGEEKVYSTYVNPGIPIPTSATDVHGITDEMVKDYPTFPMIAHAVWKMFEGADIGGYNSNRFDVPLLYMELYRANIEWDLSNKNLIDACTIYKRQESRTLTQAVKFFMDANHEGAHGAIDDVRATINVFNAQKLRYKELGEMSLEQLSLYSNYDNPRADISGNFLIEKGDFVLNFGKHKGTKAKEVKPYLSWMMQQDFLPDTLAICIRILSEK